MMPIFAALLEDNKQSGLLTADETGIAFETNSFDCEASVPETDPLYIRTSENEIVSLFNNFTTAPGRKYGPANGFISTQVVTSNAAIFSTHKWQSEDPIRLVIFSLKGAESLLTHFDQVEELKSPKNFTTPKPELFKVVHGGCTYSMFYGVSASFGGLKPTTIEPRLSIEFEQGRDFNSFLQDVNDYVAFVSFCSGKRLKPSEILICEKPADELHKLYSGKNPLSRVVYRWPEPKSKNPNMLQRPFASVRK